MSLNIGNLNSSVLLNTKNFERGVRKTVSGYQKMGNASTGFSLKASLALKKVGASITKYGKILAGVSLAAGTAFAYMTKKALDFADVIGKTSDAAGIHTDTLQELRYAAKLAGVSTDQLDKGMIKFGKTIGELRAGTGSLYTILQKTDQQLMHQLQSAKSNDEAFNILMKYMAGMESQADKSALAMAAFGRSGTKMTIMLKNGIDAFEQTRQKAQRLGLVLNEELIRNAEKANDSITTLTDVLKINFAAIILELAPLISDIADRMTRWVAQNKEFIKTKVIDTIKSILRGIKDIWTFWQNHKTEILVSVGLIGLILIGPQGALVLAIGAAIVAAKRAFDYIDKKTKEYEKRRNAIWDAANDPLSYSDEKNKTLKSYGFSGSWKPTKEDISNKTQKYYNETKNQLSETTNVHHKYVKSLTDEEIIKRRLDEIDKKRLKLSTPGMDMAFVSDEIQAEQEVIQKYKEDWYNLGQTSFRVMMDDIENYFNYYHEQQNLSLDEFKDAIQKRGEMFKWSNEQIEALKQKAENLRFGSKYFITDILHIKDAMQQVGDVMTDVMVQSLENMDFSLSSIAKAFGKTLKIVAASLTARHLMQALSSAAMGAYYLAIKDTSAAAKAFAAAKVNAAAAATFGSFLVGAGLAGMAHDGISNIPEDGTWLLQKNERVVDARTNADLKEYLKQGGGTTIVQNIEINGGNEESVLKALPALKEQIINVVNNNISNNGSIRKTILARV